MQLSRSQEAELITAIQGRGEVLLKFAYLGQEGASNWDEIAKNRSGGEGINSAEKQLLTRRISDFMSTIDTSRGVNIIDIGCGNAHPSFPVIDYFVANSISLKYVPLDISQAMLDLATSEVASRYHGVDIQPILADFETSQFSEKFYELKNNASVNLLLFLGSTLGNHSDLSRVLTNLRDSMTSKDYLIIGVEMTNLAKAKNLIPHYMNDAVKKLVTHPLTFLSIPDDSYKYTVIWNELATRIEMWADLTRDVDVDFANEKFTLGSHESLLLARSMKFSEYSITKLLSDVGFRTELLTTSQDRGYVLTMIQPTRYSIG